MREIQDAIRNPWTILLRIAGAVCQVTKILSPGSQEIITHGVWHSTAFAGPGRERIYSSLTKGQGQRQGMFSFYVALDHGKWFAWQMLASANRCERGGGLAWGWPRRESSSWNWTPSLSTWEETDDQAAFTACLLSTSTQRIWKNFQLCWEIHVNSA